MSDEKIVRTVGDPTPLRVSENITDYSEDAYFINRETLQLIKEMKVLEHIEEMNRKR